MTAGWGELLRWGGSGVLVPRGHQGHQGRLCFSSPSCLLTFVLQINCVTFPLPGEGPEQQLLKPNEWSYCDYFWVSGGMEDGQTDRRTASPLSSDGQEGPSGCLCGRFRLPAAEAAEGEADAEGDGRLLPREVEQTEVLSLWSQRSRGVTEV